MHLSGSSVQPAPCCRHLHHFLPSLVPPPFCTLPDIQWHPRINQIFVGCGGRSTGCVRTFYDPKLSSKGAVSAAARAPRTSTTEFMSVSDRGFVQCPAAGHCMLVAFLLQTACAACACWGGACRPGAWPEGAGCAVDPLTWQWASAVALSLPMLPNPT